MPAAANDTVSPARSCNPIGKVSPQLVGLRNIVVDLRRGRIHLQALGYSGRSFNWSISETAPINRAVGTTVDRRLSVPELSF